MWSFLTWGNDEVQTLAKNAAAVQDVGRQGCTVRAAHGPPLTTLGAGHPVVELAVADHQSAAKSSASGANKPRAMKRTTRALQTFGSACPWHYLGSI